MVKNDQRLSVLLVIALLICLVHAIQLKHRKEGGDVPLKMSYIWLNGSVPPAIYALPASGISSQQLLDFMGRSTKGRVGQGAFHPESQKSYSLSTEGELKEERGAYQAAPFFYLPIPLNRADTKTLMTVPGIGKTLSTRIVIHRDTQGDFNRLEDLLQVEGVGEKKLKKVRSYLSIK